MHDVAILLHNIEEEAKRRFFERDALIRVSLLAFLSGEHVFVKGPPGTGKSEVVRWLSERVSGARYFEALLSKLRPAEAILGPYDMELLEQSQFIRKKDGYLQTADIAFLDEAGKMAATLGHEILAIANERAAHEVRDGRSIQPVPLRTLFTASNEDLIQEGEDARALWDRLLFRVVVDYIEDDSNFAKLFDIPEIEVVSTTVDAAALWDVVDKVVPLIEIGDDAKATLVKLRRDMKAAGLVVSDRRWRQCRKALRANAFLRGSDVVEPADFTCLEHVLWEDAGQVDQVRRLAWGASSPIADEIFDLTNELRGFLAEIASVDGKSNVEKASVGTEIKEKLAGPIKRSLERMVRDHATDTLLPALLELAEEVSVAIYVDLLDMDEALARAGSKVPTLPGAAA